jgi:formate-dependent nitrite reductase membrane component NrfD
MPDGSEQTAFPGRYDGTTYHGRNQVKPAPFDNRVVGGYIFLAGLSGAAQILATIGDLAGGRRARGMVRRGRRLALAAPVLGAPLLIWDLHTPKRFYNMLRIFRATSPMSIGTWVLMAFSAASGATALFDALPGRWARTAARVAQVPAAATGAGLATYTAALLSATSTPLWSAAPRALAARFAGSSFAAGAAALSLGEHRRGNARLARDLDTLALLALGLEAAATSVADTAYAKRGISAARDATLDHAGARGVGIALPLLLRVGSALAGRPMPMLGQLAILAGSAMLRVGVMDAGDLSAKRPGDAFRATEPNRQPP